MADRDDAIIEKATPELAAKDTFRILIMDTVEHANQVKAACRVAGHSVIAVHTIDKAFEFLEGRNHVDVIVCAAYMEDENLFEFLKRLRNNPVHKETMFLTLALRPGSAATSMNASTESAGKVLGADGFVSMPQFDARRLIAEIEKLLPFVPMLERSKLAEKEEKKR